MKLLCSNKLQLITRLEIENIVSNEIERDKTKPNAGRYVFPAQAQFFLVLMNTAGSEVL